jgi:probable metal-binding protein
LIESIHGHEVLRMVMTAQPPVGCEALRSEIAARYGNDARFHTCSTDDLSIDELLAFLLARGKLSIVDGGLVACREEICSDI